ncbi:unnamed protein product, partial [Closterium sp. NIES-53]
TWHMDDFLALVQRRSQGLLAAHPVGATGGGARKFKGQFEGIAGVQLERADELQWWVPCHAMPCHATTCHAMPRHAMPSPCHAMSCHAIIRMWHSHPPSFPPPSLSSCLTPFSTHLPPPTQPPRIPHSPISMSHFLPRCPHLLPSCFAQPTKPHSPVYCLHIFRLSPLSIPPPNLHHPFPPPHHPPFPNSVICPDTPNHPTRFVDPSSTPVAPSFTLVSLRLREGGEGGEGGGGLQSRLAGDAERAEAVGEGACVEGEGVVDGVEADVEDGEGGESDEESTDGYGGAARETGGLDEKEREEEEEDEEEEDDEGEEEEDEDEEERGERREGVDAGSRAEESPPEQLTYPYLVVRWEAVGGSSAFPNPRLPHLVQSPGGLPMMPT